MTLAVLELQHMLPMPQRLRWQRSASSTNAEATPAARAGMRLNSSRDLCGVHCISVARSTSHGCRAALLRDIHHATYRRMFNTNIGLPCKALSMPFWPYILDNALTDDSVEG